MSSDLKVAYLMILQRKKQVYKLQGIINIKKQTVCIPCSRPVNLFIQIHKKYIYSGHQITILLFVIINDAE